MPLSRKDFMGEEVSRSKGVIFDLDGTLLNTLKDLHSALNLSLAEKGYPQKSEEEVRLALGEGPYVLLERLSGEKNNQELVELYKNYYDQHLSRYTLPYPGIEELLASLKKRGIQLGVLSNKHQDALIKICKEYFPGTFSYIVGTDAGYARKPDPAGLLSIIARMNLHPEEVLYVGDSSLDLEVAKNAQCQGLLVDWGYGQKKEEAQLKSPEDLLTLLEREVDC